MGEDTDPSRIRSLAVSAEDAIDAFVYTRENPGTAVLRVTPPFHGRMRARLHVYRVDDGRDTGALHVDPAALLDDRLVDRYPRFADTRRRLAGEANGEGDQRGDDERVNDDGGDGEGGDGKGDHENGDGNADPAPPPERVREAHAAAVESWREAARSAIVDRVSIETADGRTIDIEVKRLG